MSRTRPGKINPIFVAFLIPLVVIVAAAVFVLMRRHERGSLDQFNFAAYQQAPDNFLGNHYNLDAQIVSQLAWDEGFGKILVVKPLDGDRRLSVFLPDSLSQNLEVGERFHLAIVIKEQGLIQVEGLEKY
jgi:hypothetical protein